MGTCDEGTKRRTGNGELGTENIPDSQFSVPRSPPVDLSTRLSSEALTMPTKPIFAPIVVLGEDKIPIAEKIVHMKPEWGGDAIMRFRLDARGLARLAGGAATVVPAGKHRAWVRPPTDEPRVDPERPKCFLVLAEGESQARFLADAAPGWAVMKDAQAAGLASKLIDYAEKA